jgi:hypothetical protein
MPVRSMTAACVLGSVLGVSGFAQGRQTTPPPPAQAADHVAVTVNYTGKGPVDPGHAVLLFLLADPNVGPASRPIAPPQFVRKNGETVRFENISAPTVYIVAVYNENGTYDGGSVPPEGIPYTVYAKDAKSPPIGVKPGPKTAIKITFNDSRRWGK